MKEQFWWVPGVVGWAFLALAGCEALDWSLDNTNFLSAPRDSVPFFLEVVCLGNGFFWFCTPLAAIYHGLFSVAVLGAVFLSLLRLRSWKDLSRLRRAEVFVAGALSVANTVLWLEYTATSTARWGLPGGVLYVEDSITLVVASVISVFVFASLGLWLRLMQERINQELAEGWLCKLGNRS